MRIAFFAALTALSLAIATDAIAAPKKGAAMGKCNAGQTCAADCNTMGWCSRMVCVDGKWQKRMMGCFGNFCGPKCS